MSRLGKYVQLTKAQKEEIRRLTQFANRRIKAAFKEYEKEGKTIAPREVTGDIQIREQWHSQNYALSRSVKFTTMKEYRERLNYLRSFERMRPTIAEYRDIQREKTILAMETSLGQEVPEKIVKAIHKMSSPRLADFWNSFSDKASKMGLQYSSNAVMSQTMEEYFPEDYMSLLDLEQGE